MKMSKILGYIVVAPDSGVYCLSQKPTKEEEGVLWFGTYATLFSTRQQAKKAIATSKKYRKGTGYAWPWFDTSYVKAVVAA
jgi:hypothetical protein